MDDKNWFSAQQLAKLGLEKVIDFPRTERNSREKARKLGWEEESVECRGGKNGYMAVFRPPEDVLKIIQDFLKEKPDFFDDVYVPKSSSKPYPVSPATDSRQPSNLAVQSHATTDMRVNNFITLPRYNLPSTGYDHVIHSEQIVDYLAFKKEWLEMSLDIRNNCLALISVKDDSMEPTLKSDDLILTDISMGHIDSDSIYVLQFKNALILKRITRKMNGSVIVKSDNPVYGQEELEESAAQELPVVGKVVWYGRKI